MGLRVGIGWFGSFVVFFFLFSCGGFECRNQ